MSSSIDRVMDDALATGRANAVTIEMARRHCLHMTFTEWGGRGIAEAVSGLPINSRRVQCPYAQGNVAGMNLDWIVSEFYEQHCIGCEYRRPTGEVPNLASIADERKAAAAADADVRRATTEQNRLRWEARAERRRGLVATADPAMAKAIDDIGLLDVEPGGAAGEGAGGAMRRLSALAERAPDTITDEVVDLALELVNHVGITALLAPLRQLARARERFASSVLNAAVVALGRSPDVEAARCLADLRAHVEAGIIDAAVVRSLIYVAGAPRDDYLGRSRPSTANDPGALRVAADLVPDTIASVLGEMLPSPSQPSPFLLPPGERGQAGRTPSSEYDRASAARAVRALTATHPAIAAQVIGPLIGNLGVDGDRYDEHPIDSIERALAAMLVVGIGDVAADLEGAGRSARDELRERLFNVYETTAHLLDPNDRWREPGDPQLSNERRRTLFDQLVTTCLIRVGGDWGHNIAYQGAHLVEDLAKMEPKWAFERLDAIFGAFLGAVDEIGRSPQSNLNVLDAAPPMMRALEDFGRRHSFAAACRDLLVAIEHAAIVDVAAVCTVIVELIVDERATDRGVDVVWRLLPLLGKIGRKHGHEPGVLRSILPILYSNLLDSDAALRAGAIEAWVEIASAHRLPSSLADLLPAFLADPYLAVIRSILRGARRLAWSDTDRIRLLTYALGICENVDAREEADTLKEAMSAVGTLSGSDDGLQSYGQKVILRRAAALGPSDLRDALKRSWLPEIARCGEMATLRLAQARDPRVNDRSNAGGDEPLVSLLECGAGLLTLPTEELAAAACDLAPDAPLGSAEFAEVAWRAGRPTDAAAVMRRIIDAAADVPAYRRHRWLARLVADAAAVDAAAVAGVDLDGPVETLGGTVEAAPEEEGERGADLVRQIRSRIDVRYLLSGARPPRAFATGEHDDPSAPGPAVAARRRADRLAQAAAELDRCSQRATPTGAYMRIFAGLCQVGAHLLRLDAAELDADSVAIDAHATAARRQAAILEDDLPTHFGPDDPIGAALGIALAEVHGLKGGQGVAQALGRWGRLALPLLIVDGPRRVRRQPHVGVRAESIASAPAVAIVLASIDGRLITGPQVLRPTFVYELRLDVQPGTWPEWADRLDAELLSHLGDAEVETPVFSWHRPIDFDEESHLIGDGTLVLRFGLGAGQPAPPFLVSIRWRGTRDGEAVTEPLDVAGHSELRFRPFDASRDCLTNFPVLDERLLALYERLHRAGFDEDQIQAFCRLFTAVCRAGLTMTWDKKYKRGRWVSERQFHDELFARLQNEPELGGRLERGTPLALGFLDVRHDRITAELKVERRTPVSTATAPKYMGQPTQYAAADGSRLSILCILDMSPKACPIGTPENYVFTLQPALHGLDNPEAPSLVAVVVVNGGLPTPSSWSRRKTALAPAPPSEKPKPDK